MTIKAVIFDMDGTLIDSEALWILGTQHYCQQQNIPLKVEDLQCTTGWPAIQTARYLLSKFNNPNNLSDQQVADGLTKASVDLILARQPLFAGVREVLAMLKTQGVKMAIASASPIELLTGIVEGSKLGEYFDEVISAEELPYNKPHPMVYLEAAARLGVNPKQCVGVEDSIIGMTAVKAANMRCVVVPEHSVAQDPRWSLADIKLAKIADFDQQIFAALEQIY